MSRGRSVLLVFVVAVIVALVTIGRGGDGPSVSGTTERPSVDRVGAVDEVSSTWFCVAATAPGDPAPHHQLVIANTGGVDSQVRISVYGNEGPGEVRTVGVESGGTLVMDLDAEFGVSGLSAMVESPDGAIAVSHGVVSASMGDLATCQRGSSPVAYFPSQTTLSGTTAHLVLFNPFASDASVDVVAAVVDGIRSPTEWAGLVVPAGTTRTVDLSEQIQRRDQFSLTVRTRSGQVFAETVQIYGAVAIGATPRVQGLRLGSPVARARGSWTFSGGFTDAGSTELLIVHNPSREKVSVNVQVVPNGSVDLAPEPFELSIAPGWYSVLDLSAEGRVPDVGFHSIVVEAAGGAEVVAQRQIRLFGPSGADADAALARRPALEQGAAASNGVHGAAKTWWATNLVVGGADTPLLWITNPDDSAVDVTVTAVGPSGTRADAAVDQKVSAGDSITLQLVGSDGSEERMMYLVEASRPVVVEQLVVIPGIPDFSIVPAFPYVG